MIRRDFLKTSGVLLAGGGILHAAPDWKNQVGLELFTVRDLLAKDFEGTLARVAEIGYREVEPVGYNNLDPKAFRALLDKYKLTAPSTHAGATAGPGLEKELEGHRTMGILYTEVRSAPGSAPAAGRGQPRPQRTVESVKHTADQYNQHGRIAKKFGMKILIHNHTQEFELLDDGKHTEYDILLAETDPSLVAMQLDIGWASVAGRNILEMFRKTPGRFELWHVKTPSASTASTLLSPPTSADPKPGSSPSARAKSTTRPSLPKPPRPASNTTPLNRTTPPIPATPSPAPKPATPACATCSEPGGQRLSRGAIIRK